MTDTTSPIDGAGDAARPSKSGRGPNKVYKTHCFMGHEFTPANTRLHRKPDGSVRGRGCRTCQKLGEVYRWKGKKQ